jgi:hypothetical protein
MTNYEWRMALKKGDFVDAYCINTWLHGTVVMVDESEGYKKVKVAFRRYS